MIAFLDTDVLIECLRATTESKAWLAGTSRQSFRIPGIAAMELLMGCRDKRDLRQVQRFLDSFTVVWPNASEPARAYRLLARYCLTSGLSIPDCLIAAMALSRRGRLYTFNAKDYGVLRQLDAREPYRRS